MGVGVLFFVAQLSFPVPWVKLRGKFPEQGVWFPDRCTVPFSQPAPKHPGVVMEWRQGSDGKGEISPPMGSIVSRNV